MQHVSVCISSTHPFCGAAESCARLTARSHKLHSSGWQAQKTRITEPTSKPQYRTSSQSAPLLFRAQHCAVLPLYVYTHISSEQSTSFPERHILRQIWPNVPALKLESIFQKCISAMWEPHKPDMMHDELNCKNKYVWHKQSYCIVCPQKT